jgi:hypothetical protein
MKSIITQKMDKRKDEAVELKNNQTYKNSQITETGITFTFLKKKISTDKIPIDGGLKPNVGSRYV